MQNEDDFYLRYGWSPAGQECVVRMQLNVGARTYAVMAGMCSRGFIDREIYDESVNVEDVAAFADRL